MASVDGIVLVTGATGFIATHVIQQLLLSGHQVRGTVRSLKNIVKIDPLRQLCPEANERLELVECDLLDAECWFPAVKDCVYVVHTASPVPIHNPSNDDEVIKPAVEGTMNVLRACEKAGTVKRIVITSSFVAVGFFPNPARRTVSENDWTDINNDPTAKLSPYFKSKTLAEKAAWDFIDNYQSGHQMELVTINPTYVLGPILCGGSSFASMEMPKLLLNNQIPMLPDIGLAICDVRDVARAHIEAMILPKAAGQRHIIDNGFISMRNFAEVIAKEFRPQGYKIQTSVAPRLIIKVAGWFDARAKVLYTLLGRKQEIDNRRMTQILGITPFPMKESILSMCYSLIESGRVKKTSKYRGYSHV